MAEGIVLQLQAEALDETVSIETLLRKAYLVSHKLQLNDFEEWVICEQNGYVENTPDYRMINGVIVAYNPYRGWESVVMEGTLLDALSKMPMNNPIAAIVDAYDNSEGSFSMSLCGKTSDFLNQNTNGFPTSYRFESSKVELKKIISAVRNRILEWSLLLEENGIIGVNLSFTEKEVKKAQDTALIYHFTNNFYSSTDNTQIQQGSGDNN